MKKVIFLGLLTLGVLAIAPASQAFNYHYNQVFANGSTPFDANNNTAPGFIPYPTGVGRPSPNKSGEGGELFDLEGLQVKEKNNKVYIAMANSFGWQAYSKQYRRNYWMGDLFIGVDGKKDKFAININNIATGGSTKKLDFYTLNGGNTKGLPSVDGGYWNKSSVSSKIGAFEVKDLSKGKRGNAVDAYLGFAKDYEKVDGKMGGNGNTYVWEFCFDKSLLGDFKQLDFHAALACGNDLLLGQYCAPAPPHSVPEPTTLALFGLGAAGLGMIRRRK